MKRAKSPMSDERRIQLAEARAALSESGKSPRQLALESRMKVVEWVYRWGYTSSPIIQELLARTSGGYALKLARLGWLCATKTASGIPPRIFTLTELGKEEAERHSRILLQYSEIDPYKVDQRLIRHYLLAQEITVNALNGGAIIGYETERMFVDEGDKAGIKRPDVVWRFRNGMRVGVEVELSAKWGRHLDVFVLGILTALGLLEGSETQFDRFIVATDSHAILDRYRQAMEKDISLNLWAKDKRNHFVITNKLAIPKELLEKVDFQFLGEEEEDDGVDEEAFE